MGELAVSRALGDKDFKIEHKLVIPDPEIEEVTFLAHVADCMFVHH